MGHKTRTALTSNFDANYNGTPTQVYYGDPASLNAVYGQWFGWDFKTPFSYNGTDNLIIEVWWEGDNGAYVYNYWTPATSRCVYSYVAYGNPYYGYPNSGQVVSYLHYMRITLTPSGAPVEPTSLGRVKVYFN